MRKKLFSLPGLEHEESRFKALLSRSKPIDHILIKGPRGTGKSYFAQVYEENASKEVESFNCASFPPDLVASELFGHKRGAFTGAIQHKAGIIETAQKNGKDILLEELNSLTREGQANLLVFLETGRYHPVGSPAPRIAENVRVIATMNYEPTKTKSRLDLVDRFRIRVNVPPLYKRREDVFSFLAKKQEYQGFKLSSLELLALFAHNWPGNLRELDQALFEYNAGLGLPEHILRPVVEGLRIVCEAMRQAGLSKKRIQEIEKKLFKGKIPVTAAGSHFWGQELETYSLSPSSFSKDFQAPYELLFYLLDWRRWMSKDRNLFDQDTFNVPLEPWGTALSILGGMAMMPEPSSNAINIPGFYELFEFLSALHKAWPGEEAPAVVTKDQVVDFLMGIGAYQDVEAFLLSEGLSRMGRSQTALAEHWKLPLSTLRNKLKKAKIIREKLKTK